MVDNAPLPAAANSAANASRGAAEELELTVEFEFAAAHRLPLYRGKCFELHGHNYTLLVTVRGKTDPTSGLLVDFHALEKIVEEKVLARCDHKYLNDFLENPTAEVIVRWAWTELAPHLAGLCELKLFETPKYSATLRRA